jgi:hypothetical protein
VVVRCTGKLLDLLDANPRTLAQAQPTGDDWYANLLWVERRKCLLLTHADRLFSVFVAGVRKPDLRPLGPYLVGVIERELRAENLASDALGRLDPGQVVIARTASRRTLGYMNDITRHVRYQIDDLGGLDQCDPGTLNQRLHRSLHNYGGTYASPIEHVLRRV